jgi:hypothetical protein
VGSIPSAISTISMPDPHVPPSLHAQAASTLDAAIRCQGENDAADQRQEIEESLGKEVSRVGIEPTTRRLRDGHQMTQIEADLGKSGSALFVCGRWEPVVVPFPVSACKFLQGAYAPRNVA